MPVPQPPDRHALYLAAPAASTCCRSTIAWAIVRQTKYRSRIHCTVLWNCMSPSTDNPLSTNWLQLRWSCALEEPNSNRATMQTRLETQPSTWCNCCAKSCVCARIHTVQPWKEERLRKHTYVYTFAPACTVCTYMYTFAPACTH